MAFGTSSRVFVYWINDTLEKTISPDMNTGGDSFKLTHYGNVGTPDPAAAANLTGYNTGAWVTGNEITDGTEWAAGGSALVSVDMTVSGTVIKWDATDQASGASFSGTAYGCLIYDDTLSSPVADQGVCFLAYGGAAGVVDGTLTVVFNSAGIATISV